MTREELIEAIILERVFKNKGIDWTPQKVDWHTKVAHPEFGLIAGPTHTVPTLALQRIHRGKRGIFMSENPYSRHYDPKSVNLRSWMRSGGNKKEAKALRAKWKQDELDDLNQLL